MFAFLFLTLLSIKPDCTSVYDPVAKQQVYTVVDQWPQYPGGEVAIMKHIAANLKYPAGDDEYMKGSFIIQFIIQADGRLTNIVIPGTLPEKYTKVDKEVLRVIGIMSRWEPGQCGGVKVPVRMPFRIACILPHK